MIVKEKETPKETVKKSSLVFSMFYILGTVSHVPQSFYITANEYWMYKFRDPNRSHYNSSDIVRKTELQTMFTSYYSIVSNISMVTGLVGTAFLIQKFSPQKRIVTTLSCLLGLLVVTIIFAWVDTDSWQTEFFVLSLAIGALLNLIGSCFLLSIFHLSMKFPAAYMGAVLSGQTLCGILSTLLQIFTLAVGPSSVVKASIYFVIGTVSVAVVQIVFMTVLTKHQYYRDQMSKDEKQESLKIDREAIFTIVKKIAVTLCSMAFVAGMMVSLHPGITSLVESTDKGYGQWGDTYFVPVITFLLYNVFNFVGRECSFRFKWVKSHWVLLVIAILRLLLIPIVMICNVQPRNHLPVVLGEDWEYALIIIVLSFSSGYVMNLCIVNMPSICNPEEMGIASMLTILVMVASLAVCSFLGPLFISLI